MWYQSESMTLPTVIDETSSSVYVYVRKDIEEVSCDEGTKYVYMEQKIKKEDWTIYQQTQENSTDIADLQAENENLYLSQADMLMEICMLQIGI